MDFLITIYTMLIADDTSVLRQRLLTFYAFANQLEAELLHVSATHLYSNCSTKLPFCKTAFCELCT